MTDITSTIAELAPPWVAWLRGRRRSERTIETYHKTLRGFAQWLGEAPALGDITLQAIEAWQEQRLELSAASVIKHLTVLRSFIRWAIRRGYRSDDPTIELIWPRRSDSPPRALSNAQLAALESALEQPLPLLHSRTRSTRIRQRRAVLLMLYAGLRRSEVAGLDWRNVDLDAGRIIVVNSKWGESRVIPMHPRIAADLRTIPTDKRAGAVFGRPDGRPYDDEMIARVFSDWLCVEALEGVSCHSLRHTFATRLLQAGADVRQIQVLMGHSDLKTTSRYLRVDDAQQRAAIALLPDRFGSAEPATPRPAPQVGECATCATSIIGHPRSRKRLYCSRACKQAAHHQKGNQE